MSIILPSKISFYYLIAFKITVRHKKCMVLGIPSRLQEEDILFPVGSAIVDKVVQVCQLAADYVLFDILLSIKEKDRQMTAHNP